MRAFATSGSIECREECFKMAVASCAMLATDCDSIALITSPHVALASALSQYFQTSLQQFSV